MFRGAPLCKAAAKKQPFPKSWAVEQSTAAIRSVGNILVETPRIRLTQTVGTLALSSRGRVDLLSQEHSLNCAGCARMGEPPVCAGTAAAHHVYIYIYICIYPRAIRRVCCDYVVKSAERIFIRRELSAGYSAITSSKVPKNLASGAMHPLRYTTYANHL